MPARTSTLSRAPRRAPELALGETSQPLVVIATGLAPDFTRYHGVVYVPGQQFLMDPIDAPEYIEADKVQLVDELPTPDWWGKAGRVLLTEPGEAQPYSMEPVEGSLLIVQGTGYDPGNAVYRLHSAFNEHTKHAIALVRYVTLHNNPFACPTQHNATTDPAMVRGLLMSANVLHAHIDHLLTRGVGLPNRPKPGQLSIRHYHGTQFDHQGRRLPDVRQVPRLNAEVDDASFTTLVGARLQLCALRPGRIHWLPITVPVARYAAMVAPCPPRSLSSPFRVSHSPTKSILKGTRDFLMVCRRLRARGVPIEPVMIERKHHSAALALKATAHACFDSFALGIQGSGLEAAAMGQPVVAGDPDNAELYRRELGEVPYTYAPTWQTLEQQLERLAMDPAFYASEAERVGRYVREVHDYPAVARRYESILAKALGRDDVLTEACSSEVPVRSGAHGQSAGIIPEVGGSIPPRSPRKRRKRAS
jgi:hypothetical protein